MGKPARRMSVAQWDVFSARALEGNSLAVFSDGRGLSDAEMQSIAKEMNLSETTFILPRDPEAERDRGVRVRIFTVQEELPFAGHPTLGTAFALRGDSGAKEIALDLKVGKVPVRFEETPGQPTFAEMTQVDPVFGVQHEREAVARATGLRIEDFDSTLPIETVSTGLPYTITPIKSLAVIQKLRVDLGRADEYLEKTGGKFFYFVARETVDRGGAFTCPDAVLQRRRSGHGFGGGLRRRVDGGPWRRRLRRWCPCAALGSGSVLLHAWIALDQVEHAEHDGWRRRT